MMQTISTENNDDNDDNDMSQSGKSMSISDQSAHLVEESSDEDESDEEGPVFDVETILAQKYNKKEGHLEYLVKWDGYDVMNATWEPEESFNSTDTLMDWERKKLDIQSGQQPRFNVEKFEKRLRRLKSDYALAEKDMVEFNSELNTNIEDFLIPSSAPSAPARGPPPSITKPRSRVSITSDESSALFVPAGNSSSDESVVPLRSRRREPESSSADPSGSKQSAQASPPLPQNSKASAAVKDKAPQKKATQPEAVQAPNPRLPNPQASATAESSAPTPPVVKKPFTGFGQSARPRFTRKRGFESHWGREPVPDLDQIQLMKPSEFSKRENYGHMTLNINRSSLDGTTLETSEMRQTTNWAASDSVQMPMAPPEKPTSGGIPRSSGSKSSHPAEQSQTFALQISGQKEPSSPNDPKTAMSNRPRSPEGDSHRRNPVQGRQRSLSPYSRRPMGPIDSYRPEYSGRNPSSRRSRSPENNGSRRGSRSSPPPVNRRNSMPDSSHNRRPDAPERSRPIILSEEEQIARMPVGVPTEYATYTRTGLFFNPNDVLIHVFFGTHKEYIGPARIVGLPRAVKMELIQTGLKSSDTNQLELWFKDLHTKDELEVLVDPATYDLTNCNAWLEGFPDTNTRLFRMTEQLRRQKIAAVYNKPHSDINSWIAYAPASEFDAFLTRRSGFWRFPDNVPICLAVRGTLRPSTVLRERFGPPRRYDENVSSPLTLAHNDSPASSPITNSSRQPLSSRPEQTTALGRPSYPTSGRWGSMSEHTHPARANVHPSDGLPTMNELFDDVGVDASMGHTVPSDPRPNPHSNITDNALNPSQKGAQIPPSEMLLPLNTFFSNIGMTIDDLASSTDKIFYLHFPPEDQDALLEHGMIAAWLQCNNVMYLSNCDQHGQADPNAWRKFRETYTKGVIIFHESFYAFDSLRPRIRSAQWSPNFNFWHVRIQKPLFLSNTRFCKETAHLQRLFPHGTAFLITDDVFRDMKQAAIILAWFFERRKSTPSPTKIVFRPDVLEYLNQKLDDPARNKNDDPYVWSTIASIKQVNSYFNPSFPHFEMSSLDYENLDNPNNNVVCLPLRDYGTRSESDDARIPKGLTQEERNADHLVEAFAGWMIIESARFRKTVVISNHTNQSLMARWPVWGHVNVFDVQSFFKKWQVKEDSLLEKIKTGSKRQDDSPTTPRIPQTPKTPLESQISRDRDPRVSARNPRTSRAPQNPGSTTTTNVGTAGATGEWKAPGQHGYPGGYQ